MSLSIDKPKISIITVCLNSAVTIEATLQSVLTHKYCNLEYIVIDGGSTDGTLEIIKKYQERISVLVSERDQGISDAFNKGIALATGELIGIVSSDDFLPANVLNEVAKTWEENPDADVFFGNAVVCESGNSRNFIVKPDLDFRAIWRRQPLRHAATFVTNNAYQKYGVFDLNYKLAMDYELVLRFFLKEAKFVYVDRTLGAFKIGGASTQHYFKARREVRDISIKYGYPYYKAFFWFIWSVFSISIKRILQIMGLYFIFNIYRRISPKFFSSS